MESYIALLRGINVGGHKRIKMADLRAYLSGIGLIDVQSYIQSGNIVFKSESTAKGGLADSIQAVILKEYGFEVPTLILKVEDLERALALNPFKEEALDKVCYTFLDRNPEEDLVAECLKLDYSPERFAIKESMIWLYLANGFGRAKMNNNLFERKLKVHATARNWNTVNKLIAMVKGD